jgi:hypothetical protein
LLHPLSSASHALRLFQLTLSHIGVAPAFITAAFIALAFITVASITVVFIVVAFIVVHTYAPGWQSVSVLLRWELLPLVLITGHAVDTIPTHRATRAFSGGYRALGDRRASDHISSD